jgi:Ca2+-binding EF-hand superfamily protein
MYGLKLADVRKASGGIGTIGLGPAEDPTLYSRAQFSPEEVHRLKDAFSHLDFDKDGSITPSDITHALEKCVTSADLKPVAKKLTGVEITRMGYKNADQAVSAGILAEVDFHRKGMVEFPEFLDVSLSSFCTSLDSH